MKKVCLILLVPVLLAACKKDSSGSSYGKLLLSKVIEEGMLQYEYIYSADSRLIRTNWYNSNSGQSILSTWFMYEYNDDGTRKQAMQYNGNTGTVRRVYTYNADEKVSRVDVAVKSTTNDNLDDFDYFEVFEYDNKGQVTKVTRKEMNQTLILRRQYDYDDKGNLVHTRLHVNDDGQMEIREDNEILPGDKQIPAHWKKLMIEPEDMDLYEFFAEERKFTAYWIIAAGKITHYNYANRVLNNQGLVTSETIQLKQPNGSVINAFDRSYEYEESKSN
jgi:YD repeat-containing protein